MISPHIENGEVFDRESVTFHRTDRGYWEPEIFVQPQCPDNDVRGVILELGFSDEEAVVALREAGRRHGEGDRLHGLLAEVFKNGRKLETAFLEFLVIGLVIRPELFDGKTQLELAAELGISRACLSKKVVRLQDKFGIFSRGSKSPFARRRYSVVQKLKHWRKKKSPAATPGQNVQTPPAEGSEVAYE